MHWSERFVEFLQYEREVFGSEFPIAAYDPALIRYGEYRYVLDHLPLESAARVLDLGCESNIFMLFLASKGLRLLGVDIDAGVWRSLQQKKKRVEQSLRRPLDVSFKADDATQLSLDENAVDHVIAISSIEHMFAKGGHGDQLAVQSIARVLKPGGVAVVTVPMSNGTPFHESPRGDARFAGPYRLYTPEVLAERFLSEPRLEIVDVSYLANTTPDPRWPQLKFHEFWLQTLSAADRAKWTWAYPIFSEIFNPIVPRAAGEARPETLNTALLCLRKRP